MTILEKLKSHKGGLLRLKTELFWYGRGWDNSPGRTCLVLNASAITTSYASATAACIRRSRHNDFPFLALLLIEGKPQWIWVAEHDVEVIDDNA